MLPLPDGTATRDLVTGLVPQSDTRCSVVLAAGVSQQIAIPTGATRVLFAVTGAIDFWMQFTNAAIAVPAGNILDGTSPELNPLLRICAGKTFVSLVSASICTVQMSFFSNP